MNVIKQLKNRVRNRMAKFVEQEVENTLESKLEYLIPQLIEFHMSPVEDRQSHYDRTKDPLGNINYYSNLKDRHLAVGVPVEEVDIDISDFESWLALFPDIEKHYQDMDDVFIEKCLEHYLSFTHLEISKNDLYIDIAASGSPWANILEERGIESYRLDLAYPRGIHGVNIGADAGNTELPDNFASVLSLQCAYECFMGNADIRFVIEASRILNREGRCALVPLYLDDVHFVATSPYCNQKEILIETEAKRVWRDDEYKAPFSRHYTPETFEKRIYSNIPDDMIGKILYFRNLPEIMRHYEGQRTYCFFMFYCEKKEKS